MEQMNISLTQEFASIVKSRVQSGGYESAGEYLTETIKIAENMHLCHELEKGLAQADAGNFVDYNFSELMRELDNEI